MRWGYKVTELETHELSISKIKGASPAEDRFYTVVLFDISEPKKYRRIIKVLKGYSDRIQYSIFEAYLRRAQIKEMTESLRKIMAREDYFNKNDRIRIYRIAGNCELTAFGEYHESIVEQDVFI